MRDHQSLPGPLLAISPDRLYLAFDRIACVDCAGMAGQYTGVSYDGHRLEAVTNRYAEQWRAETGDELTCDCGRRRVVRPTPDQSGAREAVTVLA